MSYQVTVMTYELWTYDCYTVHCDSLLNLVIILILSYCSIIVNNNNIFVCYLLITITQFALQHNDETAEEPLLTDARCENEPSTRIKG